MKFSFALRTVSLFVILGSLSVACGGSSSETPMPLEPLPHSGPEPELPAEEQDDPPEAAAEPAPPAPPLPAPTSPEEPSAAPTNEPEPAVEPSPQPADAAVPAESVAPPAPLN